METTMKAHRSLLALTVAAALALGSATAVSAQAAHDRSHAAAPAKLALNHGKKWTTDAPLRTRMDEVRALMAANAPAIHAGKLAAADYRALGAAVEQKVAAIVAECKLPPDADAMLHLVVADLVEGADLMQGKGPGTPADGAHKVVTATNAYRRYFDHRGWRPLG
jgi:hypothetical protein